MRDVAAVCGTLFFLVSCAADELRTTTSHLEAQTDPSGIGFADPSPVPAGGTTLLQVFVTPGENPTSTGLAVAADLSAIGGSANQALAVGAHDDFSFVATVDPSTSAGTKDLPATITDAEGRTASFLITLDVVPAPSDPFAVAEANPATLLDGQSTLLLVAVTPGDNPVSTGIRVSGDLTSIGGSAEQDFNDSGTGTFAFAAVVATGTSPGSKLLPITVLDAQGRQSSTQLTLNVSSLPSVIAAAAPATVNAGESTLLTVTVTPGASPTSTGISALVDLSAIGGSASQALADNGDNTFSFAATVASTTPGGDKILPVTITDAEGRSGAASVTLTVVAHPCKRGGGRPNRCVR
jgi:hypothetical protein